MAQRARFKGAEGEFIPGVPAGHLSDEQFDALSAEQRAEVRSSPLYDVKTEAEMHAKADAPKADTAKGGS